MKNNNGSSLINFFHLHQQFRQVWLKISDNFIENKQLQVFAIKQFLSLREDLLATSIEEEMRKEIVQPQPQPQPLFSPDNPLTQQRFDPGLGQIRSLPIVAEQPEFGIVPVQPRIELFRGRIPNNDKLTQELREYHREADRANEIALLKQVEALKNIVSQQTKNLNS